MTWYFIGLKILFINWILFINKFIYIYIYIYYEKLQGLYWIKNRLMYWVQATSFRQSTTSCLHSEPVTKHIYSYFVRIRRSFCNWFLGWIQRYSILIYIYMSTNRLLKMTLFQMGQYWRKEQKWSMQYMQWVEWKAYGERTVESLSQRDG